jgi:cytochrome P450
MANFGAGRSRAPGPVNLPFVGVAPMLRRDPIGYLTRLARTYGDIVRFRLLDKQTYLLNHPDYIRDILVTRQSNFTKTPTLRRAKRFFGEGLLTSEGEHHMRQRRMLQPAFHRERFESYSAVMTAYARETRDRFAPNAVIDMKGEMMRLTLAIVTRALFDADIEGDAKDVGIAMADLLRSFRVFLLPFSQTIRRLPLPQNRRLDRALASVKEIVDRIIQEHRTAGGDKDDLLSTLLAIRDEDGSSLSDEQLRDEILTLFVAGHETTALALTWTWYLLSRNPECERRVHEEIDAVLDGRLPEFKDIPRLIYTERVIAESLRLYPPVWLIGRMAKEDFELDGVEIGKGSICLISPYLMHHDPRYFPDPDRFDPERWRPELREARPKFSYFPFGGGTRVCIGERFAWAELILVIATLAQKWRFRMETDAPMKAVPRLTLQPNGAVRMFAISRAR